MYAFKNRNTSYNFRYCKYSHILLRDLRKNRVPTYNSQVKLNASAFIREDQIGVRCDNIQGKCF